MHEWRILSLNCGSSSLKFGVYFAQHLLLEGEAEEIGSTQASFWTRSAAAPKIEKAQAIDNHQAAFGLVVQAVAAAGLSRLDGVGHRVVHGGPKLREHRRLDSISLKQLREAVPFAPLHLPASLAVIDAVSAAMPGVPQVVCLDTAFHRNLPDVARTLAIPRGIRDEGVQKYGFHGLSVESIVEQLTTVSDRTVVAHLGNGSSVTALWRGKSMDTTMGLTPSGGVMMGTRCGDMDPGVWLYLLRRGVSADTLGSIVDHDSGLKGVSEKTSDVRELIEVRRSDPKSDLALRMFSYQVKKAIAAMAAALGGLDMLVFTGGIGEHAAAVRNEICEGLGFLGQFETKILPAQEDLQIARIARRLLSNSTAM